VLSQTPLGPAFEPEPYREPFFSLRRPSQSILSRFIAHLLVRLLLVAPLPANLQAATALFPMSMLWSLVPSSHQVPAHEAALACAVLPQRQMVNGGIGGFRARMGAESRGNRERRARLDSAIEGNSGTTQLSFSVTLQ